MTSYIVCTIKPWNLDLYHKDLSKLPGKWHLISSAEELTYSFLKEASPRYVFFLHWSWIVPEDIIKDFECVCFHSSDVPYGRGGSPIQNLIIRGHKDTKITALRMQNELDAGPVYMKRNLSLLGRAQDIFVRSTKIICSMIKELTQTNPVPVSQQGEPVIFKRRKGKDNEVPQNENLEVIYDHIRMLDAETYPRSHIIYGNMKIEFSEPEKSDDHITAQVRITRV
ncbi:MAG: methionyl-tRNA formyltransferase [Alphaproteobacteria bacterium]|jgi:methionyl-tRNA formyltransferase|nr:methionyl-tRNA formyltransferase [Alphaproteobacteria bacterium]MBT5389770.1 methionyl-tRNA formyltransferase [Alphaproteobacteria bacterium]MBT5540864.1 methionyl-tRNA formyltransferase [Alphaproteobacteria bacterium]MBT5654524.1 methionyl-tRNA formyltransferase [Alphaproteobacteria bacterium]